MTRHHRTGAACAAALALLAMAACSGAKTSSSTGTAGGLGANGANGAGSSGGASSGGTTGGGGTYTTVCEQLTQSLVSYLNTCQFASATEQSAFQMELNQECGATQALITAQLVQYTPARASECAQFLDISTFGCQGDALLGAVFCEQALTEGIVAVNGSCQSKNECAPLPDGGSVACVPTPGGLSCGGTCTLAPSLGDPCSDGCANGDICLSCSSGVCPSPTDQFSDGGPVPQVCTGPVGLGDDCARGDLSCVTGAYCDTSNYPDAVCAPQVAGGAVCPNNNSSACVSGYFCGEPGDGGFTDYCLPLLPEGSRCEEYTSQCGTGLYCAAPDDGGFTGVCAAQGGIGAACNYFGSSCLTPLECGEGSSGSSPICGPESAAVGEPCTANTDCLSPDGGDATCSVTNGEVGTCVASSMNVTAVHLGAACPGGSGTFCDPGLIELVACVNGVCVPPATVGSSCSSTQPCQLGLSCNAGTCAAQFVVGQGPCVVDTIGTGDSSTNSCSSGYCNPSTHLCAALLDAGDACVPTALDCSGSGETQSYFDGGMATVDYSCVTPTDGGVARCSRDCN